MGIDSPSGVSGTGVASPLSPFGSLPGIDYNPFSEFANAGNASSSGPTSDVAGTSLSYSPFNTSPYAGTTYNPLDQITPTPYEQLSTAGTDPSNILYSTAADGNANQPQSYSYTETASGVAGVGLDPGVAPTSTSAADTTFDYQPAQTTNDVFNYYGTNDTPTYSYADTSFGDASNYGGSDTSSENPVVLDLAGNGITIMQVQAEEAMRP